MNDQFNYKEIAEEQCNRRYHTEMWKEERVQVLKERAELRAENERLREGSGVMVRRWGGGIMNNERYKQLMNDVGLPNSLSLLTALRQVENEVSQPLLAEIERLRKAKCLTWSFIRTLLEQGAAIRQDYDAGKFGESYEAYSARIDEAAREREDALTALEQKA